MIQKKVCVLGAWTGGWVRLLTPFLTWGISSQRFFTTLGVRLYKIVVMVEAQEMHLMVWDMTSAGELVAIRLSYLRGASGYIVVADGTRRETLATALSLQKQVEAVRGPVPFVLVLTEGEAPGRWESAAHLVRECLDRGWTVVQASPHTGLGAEAVFRTLAQHMLVLSSAEGGG